MVRTLRKYFLAVFVALSFAACQHMPLPTITIKPSAAETQLAELVKKQDADNKVLNQKIADAEATFKSKFDANISLGTASVMASLDTLNADPAKSEFTLAAIPALEVAVAALPQPTLADYKKTAETQRKLLSKQASEIEAGKKEIEAQKGDAKASKDAQAKALADKAAVEKEKGDAEITYNAEKDRLSKLAIQQTNDAAQLRAEQDAAKLATSESRKNLEKWVVTILMIVGVIAGIIAAVVKGPTQLVNPMAALASAACIGLAIGVSFLPMSYLIGALAILFGLILFVVISEWRKQKSIGSALAGAQAEYITANPTSTLAAHVEEWTGKDTKVAKLIDDTQKQLNVK